MRRAATLLALAALLAAAPAMAQRALSWEAPAGWKRGPYSSPVVYTAPGNDAEIQVYDFQRYDGNVAERLRQTRLFELIAIEHREDGAVEPPQVGEIQVQGAGRVPYAVFAGRRGGTARLHFRVAIPGPGSVALVDYQARTPEAWKRETPAVDRFFASLRVADAPAPEAAEPAPAGGAAGLYLATVRRMVFRATGGTEWTTSTEFYLLSADGKAYRGHGLPEVPGGDLRRFDFDRARRADPGNTGTYTARGGRVMLAFGAERIEAKLGADELEVRGTRFKRSVK